MVLSAHPKRLDGSFESTLVIQDFIALLEEDKRYARFQLDVAIVYMVDKNDGCFSQIF